MTRPNHRAQIVAALRAHGPMTAAEIAERLDIEQEKINDSIASARYQSPGLVFHIVRYLPVTGHRMRDLCVFDAGEGQDLPRKTFTPAREAKRRVQAKARYRARHLATLDARSIARRAERTGRTVSVNPWLQLATPSARSAMARIANDMGAAG